MLDLHEESGLAAIKECGIFDKFVKLTGECTEAQRVSDKDGNILWTDEGDLSNRPEITRHALTKLLISHLPSDRIQWGRKLRSASHSSASGHRDVGLDFGPHGEQTFDLVIGADGAWSAVRKLLTDVKPHYEGRHFITLNILGITNKFPHLAQLVGTGSFSALGNRHGVMSQRGPRDSARITTFLTTEDEHLANTAGFEGRTARVAELVTVACNEETADNPDGAVDVRPLYKLPVGHSWTHRTGATFIGDAAHLMGPWAGEGVNLAMWNSLLLAHAIGKTYETARTDGVPFHRALDPLLEDFEVDMVARAKGKAKESLSNGEMMFGEDGATAFQRFFQTYFEAAGR